MKALESLWTPKISDTISVLTVLIRMPLCTHMLSKQLGWLHEPEASLGGHFYGQ